MSKIPVTEVCLIHLKGPYNLKDPSTPEGAIWASSISTLRKCPGFRDIYTGSIVEDGTKARMFLNWDSKEDHLAFYATPHFPAFRAQLLSLCAVPPIPIHVPFQPAQPKALEASVVEIAMVYFDAGVTAERMEAWENRWRGFVRGVGEGDGGGLDVCGGWVGEGMEGEGGDGEMRVWMGMGGEGEEAVGGLLRGAEGVVKREIYHVELS